MTRFEQRHRHQRRDFFIFTAAVIISGLLLWSQGYLISPFEGTLLLLNTAADANSLAEETDSSTADSGTISPTERGAVSQPAVEPTAAHGEVPGTMTLEALSTELTAAGVDVEALSADLTTQGRSLETLLTVVNTGRVTVAELATRLIADSAATTEDQPAEVNSELESIQWDEFGSIVYDLWLMLAATIVVIVIARPAGWLAHALKRRTKRSPVKS